MSLPLKKTASDLPEDPGPKVVSMRTYDPDAGLDDSAAQEAEFVVRRASEALADAPHPLHEFGERLTRTYDLTMQQAAASTHKGVDAVSDLAKQNPIRFIAVVAAAAFAAGFMLRMWRSPRG
jgi:ElaB/YqjD/DUF883 family membrane-anchored ribosome-binding protein